MCNERVQAYIADELAAINKIMNSSEGFEEASVLVECAIERVNRLRCDHKDSNIYYRDCRRLL